MVQWHQGLSGHEFEETLGDAEGQGSLVFCPSWGHKGSDTTEQLNNSGKNQTGPFQCEFGCIYHNS